MVSFYESNLSKADSKSNASKCLHENVLTGIKTLIEFKIQVL